MLAIVTLHKISWNVKYNSGLIISIKLVISCSIYIYKIHIYYIYIYIYSVLFSLYERLSVLMLIIKIIE